MTTRPPFLSILPMLLSTVGTATLLPAQRRESAVLATPAAVLVTDTTPLRGGTPTRGTIYTKKSGFQPVVAAPRGAASLPVFDFGAILGAAAAARVVVDGMSVGLDSIPADPCTGVLDFATCGCWSEIVFAVDRTTASSSASPVIAGEAARPDGAGADLFGYVSPSALLPDPGMRGTTTLVLDSPEMGLFDATRPTQRGQITAFDAHVPIFELGPSVLTPATAVRRDLFERPIVYFSVTGATAMHVPAAFWGSGPAPSGATILRAEWDPVATVWTPLAPLYTARDLGLPANAEIDAIAYDRTRDNLVISLSRATTPAGLSQFVFVARCADGPIGLVDYAEIVGGTTRSVADGAGVGSSTEVVAACEEDPSRFPIQIGTTTAPLMSFLLGTPQLPNLPLPRRLHASAFRGCGAVGGLPSLDVHVVGSSAGSGPSFTDVLVSFPAFPSVGFLSVGPIVRPTGAGPVTQVVPLPAPFLTDLQGIEVQLHGVDIRLDSSGVSVSRPVLILI